MEESEIVDNAFSLIFAFDEIVALGYRENVNLAQIRTFTEMDSHEEKVFEAVRQVRAQSCSRLCTMYEYMFGLCAIIYGNILVLGVACVVSQP